MNYRNRINVLILLLGLITIFLLNPIIFAQLKAPDEKLLKENGIDISYDGKYKDEHLYKDLLSKILDIRKKAFDTINKTLGLNYQDNKTVIIKFIDAQPIVIEPIKTYEESAFEVGTETTISNKKHQLITCALEYIFTKYKNILQEELTHEIFHGVLRDLMGDSHELLPKWIREGLALYAVGQGEGRIHYLLIYADGECEKLVNGLEGKHTLEDYAEDYLAFDYIRSKFGEGEIKQFVNKLIKGSNYRAALKELTNDDWETFQKNLRAHALKRLKEIATKDSFLQNYQEVHKKVEKKDYHAIISATEEILQKTPDDYLAANLKYYRAKAFSRLGKYQEAIKGFQEIVEKYSDKTGLDDEAKFYIGWCYYQQGKYEEAASELAVFVRDYPYASEKILAEGHFYLGFSLNQLGKTPEAKEVLSKAVRSFPKDQRVKEANQILDNLGGLAGPDFEKILREGNDPVARAEAAQALGEKKVKAAVPTLIKALKDDLDIGVRMEAAWALGEIGDTNGIPALVEALQDKKAPLRVVVAESLGKMGNKNGLELAIKELQTSNDILVKRLAATALGIIKDKQAIPVLTEALKDKDEKLRIIANQALIQIGKVDKK